MFQIFLNWLTIFIIPALIGVTIRLAFMKWRKGYIVPIIFFCISVVMSVYALLNYGNGDEGPGLLAVSSLTATAACVVCGVIIRIVKIVKKKKQQAV